MHNPPNFLSFFSSQPSPIFLTLSSLLSLSLYLPLSMSLSLSLYLYLPLSFPFSLSLSLYLPLSLSLLCIFKDSYAAALLQPFVA